MRLERHGFVDTLSKLFRYMQNLWWWWKTCCFVGRKHNIVVTPPPAAVSKWTLQPRSFSFCKFSKKEIHFTLLKQGARPASIFHKGADLISSVSHNSDFCVSVFCVSNATIEARSQPASVFHKGADLIASKALVHCSSTLQCTKGCVYLLKQKITSSPNVFQNTIPQFPRCPCS